MTGAYYSEHDPAAAEWLRELMKAGLIPGGEVDERDIRDVQAADLRGFAQVHLFAGIGGWPFALRLAGWGGARGVWTGSCPCQPYSSAGKGLGDADPRNLWPAMFGLVRECRPHVVFGEQVEGAVRHGWLDGVCSDLEGEGYAVGAAVLGAHSAGAPHIRQRLYWVADTGRVGGGAGAGHGRGVEAGERVQPRVEPEHRCGPGVVADSDSTRAGRHAGAAGSEGGTGAGSRWEGGEHPGQRFGDGRAVGGVGNTEGPGRARGEHPGAPGEEAGGGPRVLGTGGSGATRGVDDADGHGLARPRVHVQPGEPRQAVPDARGAGPDHWSGAVLIPCRDGKQRRAPAEPELFPLAPGLPGRVGLLRGSGNAICPQTAALFIQAYREARGS